MELDNIKRICNLGTGTMGFGTALLFAMAGYEVNMFGRSEASIQKGREAICSTLKNFRDNGRLTEEEGIAILSRVNGVTTLKAAAENTQFVIESVAEDLEVKRQVFVEMEALCSPDVIFATNTSGLSPTAIAEPLTHKDRFVVAHFWNPPHLIPLVEVVPGKQTAQQTVDTTWKLMEKIGKKPVALNREALGFVGNRLQLAMLREALHIVESGIATAETVDTAVKYSLGRRWSTTGPLESADLGGLDIFYNISGYLMKDLCSDTGVPPLLKQAVESGFLGAKTGKGLYNWTPDELARIKKLREDNLLEWLQKDSETKL